MSEMQYCYCCRSHHPVDQMRQFPTRAGIRWRCLRSIQAAQRDPGERDAFGRQQTAINRRDARQVAERPFVPLAERHLLR